MIALPIDEDEAAGVADRECVEDHLIHERIDGGRGADTERERQERRGAEAWRADERAQREAQVVEEITEPAAEPDVPNLLADLGYPKFDGDPAAGLGLGNSRRGEVDDAAVVVVLELAVETALERSTAE